MRVWPQENGSTHSAVWTEQRHPQHLPDNLWLRVLADIGLSCRLNGKESSCQCRRPGFSPWVGKIPWRRKWQATPVFLPGKFHKQRSFGGLQSMGSQRVGHNLETKQQHIIRISSSPYQTPTTLAKHEQVRYPHLPLPIPGKDPLLNLCQSSQQTKLNFL